MYIILTVVLRAGHHLLVITKHCHRIKQRQLFFLLLLLLFSKLPWSIHYKMLQLTAQNRFYYKSN